MWRRLSKGVADRPRREVALPLAAVASLALAMLVYMADRSPARVALLPAVLALGIGPTFGALGLWLPSFAHPFAFGLLTAALRAPDAAPAYGACLGWWAVNVAFEVGQHPDVAPRVAEAAQRLGFDDGWTRPLTGYLLHGTFDGGDLLAATLGALAAAALVRAVHRQEVLHVS
jgi:hypothetical protein